MLKITELNASEGLVLRIEGRLAGPWVDELRRVYAERRRSTATPLIVDLAGVAFIDTTGVAFLDEVYSDVLLINCSLFAAEQLRVVRERHGKIR